LRYLYHCAVFGASGHERLDCSEELARGAWWAEKMMVLVPMICPAMYSMGWLNIANLVDSSTFGLLLRAIFWPLSPTGKQDQSQIGLSTDTRKAALGRPAK